MGRDEGRGGMRVLRDLRLSTKVLILLDICRTPRVKFRVLAERLGMSVQGVSEYVRHMSEDGLVEDVGGYRATRKGIQFLHDHFGELRSFVERASRDLRIVNVCTAVARTSVHRGDRVGLFMEGGLLTAYAGKRSSSEGVSMSDAAAGMDIAVQELEGMVDLRPGMTWIVRVPSAVMGGSRKMDIDRLKKALKKVRRSVVAVHGIEAEVLAERLGLKVDVRFAPLDSVIDASLRGLDVLLFVSSDLYHEARVALEDERSSGGERIPVKEIILPEGGS